MFINDCIYKYNNKLFLVHEFCKYDITFISKKYINILNLPLINSDHIQNEISLCNKYYRDLIFDLNKWEMCTKLIVIPENIDKKKKLYDINGLIYNSDDKLYTKFIQNGKIYLVKNKKFINKNNILKFLKFILNKTIHINDKKKKDNNVVKYKDFYITTDSSLIDLNDNCVYIICKIIFIGNISLLNILNLFIFL